jgi:hypothetical protein
MHIVQDNPNETPAPSRGQIINNLKEQIEISKLRAKLQGYKTSIAVNALQETHANHKLAEYAASQIEHPDENTKADKPCQL